MVFALGTLPDIANGSMNTRIVKTTADFLHLHPIHMKSMILNIWSMKLLVKFFILLVEGCDRC